MFELQIKIYRELRKKILCFVGKGGYVSLNLELQRSRNREMVSETYLIYREMLM